MPDLVLRSADQAVMRTLLASEPVVGRAIPGRAVLEAVTRLIPCDAVGVSLTTETGLLLELASLPTTRPFAGVVDLCDGRLGPVQLGRIPGQARSLAVEGLVDGLVLGVRNGPDHVVRLALGRERVRFSERDVAMLRLLGPVLARLMRERPTPALPAELTLQERRVLMEVASGRSNREIATALCIAESTVRKHLEHVFRKLGVSSRLGAVVALQDRVLGRDGSPRMQGYA